MFSETTCNFEGLFVVVGFYSFSWVFDFSASSERECVGEGDIASHPAFLCISLHFCVFRFPSSLFPSTHPLTLPLSPSKNRKALWLEENSFF